MGKVQKGQDLLLYIFILGLVISLILFVVTSGIRLPPLDVSIEWEGLKITFTGISEIIVAIGFAIGIVWRLKK